MTRALIFANGEINDGAMVQRALTHAPDALVVAADGGARVAAYYGVKVDVVIGDMDSLSAAEIEALARSGAELHRFSEEKNETDLELALMLVCERGASWIRIVGAVGDRLDQTLSNIYLLALPALEGRDARIVAGTQETRLVQRGTTVIDGAAGDTISLIPLNGAVRGVRTEGMYYPLRDEDLFFGLARGVSNVMTGAQASVTTRAGVLLLVHTIGRA